jgi:3-hydroxybutyryl-CoA dehydratase
MPGELRPQKGLYFEEYEVGQTIVSLGRTVSEADVMGFAGLTGDWNPLHTDAVFAAQHPLGQRVAHGLLGLSMGVGLAVRLGFLDETLLAFREIESWKFSLPIFLGDTIHMRATVVEKKAVPRLNGGMISLEAEILNQTDQVVQRGTWNVLIKSKEAA